MERAIGRTWRSDPPKKDRISEGIPVGISDLLRTVVSGREEVCLEYKPSVKEGDFLTALKQAADRDRLLTYTTVGIHRDDLVLNIGDYAVRKIGSQGQKKTFLIALKLAQYHWLHQMSEVKPLLLLDDIFDKLDADRVEQIVKIVGGEMFGQVFITDTIAGISMIY